ncbi:hypothetical protein STENM327S_00282 [Streptomyces tendae]
MVLPRSLARRDPLASITFSAIAPANADLARIDGFGYLGRQSGGRNGRVAGYEVAVSDDGEDWTTVARGTLKDVPQTQRVSFDRVRASYVRFTALDALDGQPCAAAAERRVYGVPVDLPTGYPPGERPADVR